MPPLSAATAHAQLLQLLQQQHADRPELVRYVEQLSTAPLKVELLTSREAATLLGVSSANTVKNWLEGGHFPGAYRTEGGHWRFPRTEVEAMRDRLSDLRDKNRRGDLSLPEACDDESSPPLL